VHTKQIQIPVAGRRGRYSEAFKTQVVTAARQPGVSTAAVALANGLNAKLLRRWISESESPRAVVRANLAGATPAQPPFVALQMSTRSATPESIIHIEPQRAGTTVFDSALARVVYVFGAAHPQTAYLFANQRADCTRADMYADAWRWQSETRMVMYEVVVGGFALFSVADY
jgi:transposase